MKLITHFHLVPWLRMCGAEELYHFLGHVHRLVWDTKRHLHLCTVSPLRALSHAHMEAEMDGIPPRQKMLLKLRLGPAASPALSATSGSAS